MTRRTALSPAAAGLPGAGAAESRVARGVWRLCPARLTSAEHQLTPEKVPLHSQQSWQRGRAELLPGGHRSSQVGPEITHRCKSSCSNKTIDFPPMTDKCVSIQN